MALLAARTTASAQQEPRRPVQVRLPEREQNQFTPVLAARVNPEVPGRPGPGQR